MRIRTLGSYYGTFRKEDIIQFLEAQKEQKEGEMNCNHNLKWKVSFFQSNQFRMQIPGLHIQYSKC